MKRLAARLREDGLDARLDAWHLKGLAIPEFMNREIRHADKILIVCSPGYRRKVHAMEDGERSTGVGWESVLISSAIWANLRPRDQVEVVLLRGVWAEAAPDFLVALPYLDLSDIGRFEAAYRELLLRLTGQREEAPPVGPLSVQVDLEPVEPLRGTGFRTGEVSAKKLREQEAANSGKPASQETRLRRGIAVVVHRVSETAPAIAPLTVRLTASERPTGQVSPDDGRLRGDAASSVTRAGAYFKRLRGHLRELVFQDYWGVNKPYSCVLFELPEGSYMSSAVMRVGMLVGYVAKVLGDILRHDFRLPIEFPQCLFVIATGLDEEQSEFSGQCVADTLLALDPEQAAVVLLGSSQQIAERLFERSLLRKELVDNAEQSLVPLLLELLREVQSDVLKSHLSQKFKSRLSTLIDRERAVKDACVEIAGRESVLTRIGQDILISEKEREYLKHKAKAVRAMIERNEEVPSPSDVLASFTSVSEDLRRELGPKSDSESPTQPANPTMAQSAGPDDASLCRRLYRRLAGLCHPDKNPLEAMTFPTLVEHRWDRLYLEALEACLDPFGPEHGATEIEESVCSMFDRLAELERIAAGLEQRTSLLSDELQDMDKACSAQLNEELGLKKAILRIQELDIDQAWRDLNLLLAWRTKDGTVHG